jgi:hypothetical protein
MLKTTLIILSFILSLHVKAQDSCQPVKSEIIKTFYKSDKVRSNDTFFYSKNVFTVSLIGGFKDSVKIYIGNNLVFNDFLLTDGSPGHSRETLQVPFNNRTDRPQMKIFFVNKNTCLTEALNLRFPILEVRQADRWYLTYTNHFASLE